MSEPDLQVEPVSWDEELAALGLWPTFPEVHWPLYRHCSRVALRAFQFLRNTGGQAEPGALLRKALALRGKSPEGLEEIARLLFAETPGLVELPSGRWAVEMDSAALEAIAAGRFVVFDLETTGGKPPLERITEIGAVRVHDGELTETFQTLVNPRKPIPPFVARLTGITNKMVRRQPHIEHVLPDFLEFIEGHVLIAHDVFQDLRFVDQALLNAYNGVLALPVIDTLVLAKQHIPPEAGYSLRKAAEYLEVESAGAHRALADALMTAQLFLRLRERIGDALQQQLLAGYAFRDGCWRELAPGLPLIQPEPV